MQTDPNFANYRYQPGDETQPLGRIVLLDFGAARDIPSAIATSYRALLAAALAGDGAQVRAVMLANGMLGPATAARHGPALDAMIAIALEPMTRSGPFDFGAPGFVTEMRERGMAIAADRATWHAPPPDLLFIQRKLGGMFLLASRLQARVDIRTLLNAALSTG
jgi:hypothetical protein